MAFPFRQRVCSEPVLLEGQGRLIVKNTFLDVDNGDELEDSNLRGYRRAKTVSQPRCSTVEVYENATESSAPTSPSPSPMPSLSSSGCSNWVSEHSAEGSVTPSPAIVQHPTVYTWTVDARKLRGSDRSIVSRPFELAFGGHDTNVATFKLMICAKSLRDAGKGGQSFKLSRGQGSMQLKCEQELHSSPTQATEPLVDVSFSIASRADSGADAPPTRIVRHNFVQSAACVSLDWDFRSVVTERTQTFVAIVKIAPAA